MTNEQILKKVIEKAEKNGWEKTSLIFHENLTNDWNYPDLELEQVHYIISSHDFLKAFFGEEIEERVIPTGGIAGIIVEQEAWKIHAQGLALAEDRLKYLEKFL